LQQVTDVESNSYSVDNLDKFKRTDHRAKTRCFVLFALLFTIYQISCFSNGWLINGDEYLGLWQLCSESVGCLWMEQSPSYDVPFLDWFSTVRAFLLLTSIFTIFAMAFQIANIYCDQTISMFPVRVCAIFNVLYLLLSIIIFPTHKPNNFDDIWQLGWSYYVTCVACLLSILQATITFRVGRENRPKKVSPPGISGPPIGRIQINDPTSAEGAVARDDWTLNGKSFFNTTEADPLPEKKSPSSLSSYSGDNSGSSSGRSSRSSSVTSGSSFVSSASSYSSDSESIGKESEDRIDLV